MRNRRVEAVKKRIAKRKKLLDTQTAPLPVWSQIHSSEHLIEVDPDFHPHTKRKNRPVSEWVIFRFLVSAALVLVLALIYATPEASFQTAKKFVGQAFHKDFQFASVSAWINKTVGDLYSFSPFQEAAEKKAVNKQSKSVPVSGRILESFTKNGQGVMVETAVNKTVTAIADGVVIFAGNDETHGRTIIVQQADDTNVWYGNLGELEANLYQHVKKGDKLGTVSKIENTSNGEYYLAMEKNDEFIDPTQVISFD